MKTKTMEELGLTLIGGQIVQRLIVPAGLDEKVVDPNRGTIVAKTINNGNIDDNLIVYNNYSAVPDSRRLTKKGDVVIKITEPFSAAVVDEKHEGLLVSSFCMIINSFGKEITPTYLVAYLNSKNGREAINHLMTGSTIKTLGITNLRKMDIPVPTLEKQEEISNQQNKIKETYALMAKLVSLNEEKLDAMFAEMED